MPVESFENVLSWATDLEEGARAQAIRTASMPFVEKPLALMPDAHYGIGSTVGSVIATKGAIIPAAVGVDIGCGMIAVRLGLTSQDLPDNLDALHALIAQRIPSGVGKGFEGSDNAASLPAYDPGRFTIKQESAARRQMGSLGSGNHFVEVCLDTKDRVWLVLHSGSRGVGNQLATIHINKAKKLMQEWFVGLPHKDLAYFPQHTQEFRDYIADMLWAQKYAMTNRSVMMSAAVTSVREFLGIDFTIRDKVNCHHNFTQEENHGKRGKVWVTRKGAIKAEVGDMGVIPGSMGTRSYIVEGKGNPLSYNSCSHGAGRRMGRKQAERTFSDESLIEAMAGKTWNSSNVHALIDEHPESYKNIDQVMENQKDLVVVKHVLHQILNYKGV